MTSGMTLPDPALLARDRGIELPCQRRDGALWYPEAKDPQREAIVDYARAICRACPLRVECLNYAMSVPERYGMWGGLTESERDTLLRGKRPRDRVARDLAGPTHLPVPTVPARTVAASSAA